jgi:ribosomal protein S18 acetylase RimI-like enzyme
MSANIREATIDDVRSIAEFQVAMAMETENKQLDPSIVEQAVRAVFDDARRGFYLVGEVNGDVVGSLLITYEWSDWRNCNTWYIQSLFVETNHRGQGVFKNLYRQVIDLAKTKNVMFVRLYVEVDNQRAQKVYESLGMKRMPYYMYDVNV